jgi:O-methyltransferase involved in polyketide biosynthesis
MHDKQTAAPDSTAVRVALWRAIHVQVDAAPPVLEDELGLRLAAPDDGWRQRPDMNPEFTSGFRAGIVARARFIEDLVAEQSGNGVAQYVILGAGLDTFAQRQPEIASRLRVFEVDQPRAQVWKRQRLIELGFGIAEWLQLVPVDFEAGSSWWEAAQSGRLRGRPTGGRGLYRSEPVPHQECDRGHIAPNCGTRPGLHPGHDVPVAARPHRTRGAPRIPGGGERRTSRQDALPQLL